MKIKRWLSGILCLVLMIGISSETCQAQQTIFNVPSADVTPRHKLFVQHESQFRAWEPGNFWQGTHYASYGLGHQTELDATLINLSAPSSGNIALMPGIKHIQTLLPQYFSQRDIKLTVGAGLPVSLQGQGVGSWGYGHLSGRLPRLKTRLTAGISGGTRQLFGRNTVHFIGGLEQPVTKRLTLIGDWFSGTHNNGFLITGFSYILGTNSTVYLGYQIPNNSRCGRSGLVFEISRLF